MDAQHRPIMMHDSIWGIIDAWCTALSHMLLMPDAYQCAVDAKPWCKELSHNFIHDAQYWAILMPDSNYWGHMLLYCCCCCCNCCCCYHSYCCCSCSCYCCCVVVVVVVVILVVVYSCCIVVVVLLLLLTLIVPLVLTLLAPFLWLVLLHPLKNQQSSTIDSCRYNMQYMGGKGQGKDIQVWMIQLPPVWDERSWTSYWASHCGQE